MSDQGFALFDTAIGRCGIAWGPRGVTGLQLPEAVEELTRARLRRHHPGAKETAPPEAVGDAIAAITALLSGEARDLTFVALDTEEIPAFNLRVYEVARMIKPGSTLTYGEIAKRIGEPEQAQAVGQALGRNPFTLIVPCHRVVAAGGKLGGFSANGGRVTKERLLEIEGALPANLFS